MKSFILDCLGAIVIVSLATMVVPLYADYRAHAETDAWLDQAQPIQQQITERILRTGSTQGSGSGLAAPDSSSGPELFRIEDSGTLIMKGGHVGQTLALIPQLEGQTVRWLCVGGPDDAMSARCNSLTPSSH